MADYPADWEVIRQRVIRGANRRCEWCAVRNGEQIRRHHLMPHVWRYTTEVDPHTHEPEIAYLPDKIWVDPITVRLQVAHLFNEDPADCDEANLVALCQYHHLSLDARRRRWKEHTGQTTPSGDGGAE